MDMYINKNQTKLRYGYTTGTCAAAAATACVRLLLFGEHPEVIKILTPKGIMVNITTVCEDKGQDYAVYSVIKDSGDDPDVTNGIKVYVKVTLNPLNKDTPVSIHIDGGIGVGRVTRPGLEQEVGAAAINKVPRKMIADAVHEVCELAGFEGEVNVVISVPEGVEIAKRTFNPRLGIEGGISILGTSGIVEPMSEQALIDTIEVVMKMHKVKCQDNIIVVPGNYGEEYVRKYLNIVDKPIVKCSNYIGETLDLAVGMNFKRLLLVGNFGKLVKLAAGIMNTHSKIADGRFEIIGVHAAMSGVDAVTVKQIMECITTEQALDILEENNVLNEVLNSIINKIETAVNQRVHGLINVGVVIFSEKRGFLIKTDGAKEIIESIVQGE